MAMTTTGQPALPIPALEADQREAYDCLFERLQEDGDPPRPPHRCRYCGWGSSALWHWLTARGHILDPAVVDADHAAGIAVLRAAGLLDADDGLTPGDDAPRRELR
jgi:hypothetical protein